MSASTNLSNTLIVHLQVESTTDPARARRLAALLFANSTGTVVSPSTALAS